MRVAVFAEGAVEGVDSPLVSIGSTGEGSVVEVGAEGLIAEPLGGETEIRNSLPIHACTCTSEAHRMVIRQMQQVPPTEIEVPEAPFHKNLFRHHIPGLL